MIEVNLLPPEYRRVERTPLPRLVVLVVGTGMVVASLFYLVLIGWVKMGQEKSRERDLNETKARQAAPLAERSQLEAEIGAIESRKNTISNIWQTRMIWSRKLDQLCDIVPRFIGFTRLEFLGPQASRGRLPEATETGGTLTVDCLSATSEEKRLADFLRVLQGQLAPEPPATQETAIDFFKDFLRVDDSGWKKNEYKEYAEKEALEFRLELPLKPPGQQAIVPTAARTAAPTGAVSVPR